MFLIGSAPFEASTVTRPGLFADWIALSAQDSMPKPLYTKTFAVLRPARSCAFGSKSCGSVPSGIMVEISTLSLPTASVNSFMALKVTETFSLSAAASLTSEDGAALGACELAGLVPPHAVSPMPITAAAPSRSATYRFNILVSLQDDHNMQMRTVCIYPHLYLSPEGIPCQ